ncbi:variant 2 [Lathyrus oleraceus]|uniref:Variant 2 n=1 Tax=Pisum sativum TaxID=3888 RepID=A0A9D4YEX8_PEA|nr:variant 2 [Pisum sativum]
MEAGTALRLHFTLHTPISVSNRTSNPKTAFTLSSSPSRSHSSTVHSFLGPKPKRDFLADWASQNDDVVRPLPIYVGTASLFAVLFNRAISGIAPVADAGSSQSRADLLTLGLAVTNILAGLVWLSIRPKSIAVVSLIPLHSLFIIWFKVNPQGAECKKLCTALPDVALTELLWVWESLSDVTCCRSLVIVYESSCVLQFGFAAESSPGNGEVVSVDTDKLMQGSVYQGVVKSGTQSYLANLSLYPGKSELPFLPSNTQFERLRYLMTSQPFGPNPVMFGPLIWGISFPMSFPLQLGSGPQYGP